MDPKDDEVSKFLLDRSYNLAEAMGSSGDLIDLVWRLEKAVSRPSELLVGKLS